MSALQITDSQPKVPRQIFVYPTEMMLALYLTVLGYMIPVIRETFQLSLTAAGLFSTLQAVGLFVALILCFCVFSGLNKTRVVALSMLALALCMVLLGINRAVFALYVLFFFIGVFNAVADSMSNALIVDLSGPRANFYTSLLHALWALAGVIGPFFAILLHGDYTTAFVGLGILSAAAVVVFLFGLKRDARQPFVQSRANMGTLKKLLKMLRIRGMPLFALLAFFNCFTQMSYVYFIGAYAEGLAGISLGSAAAISLLFGGFLFGRVMYSLFGHRFSTFHVVLVLNALSLAAFVAMLFCANAYLIGALIFIGAIGISISVPALVVEATALVPADTAAAAAIVYFGIGFGGFFGPLVAGAVGDAIGLQYGLLVSTASLVPFLVLAAFASRRFVSLHKRPVAD